MGMSDRYLVISADGHAGADLLDYKPYLASRWHDEFDAWAASYVNPWGDLVDPDANRNWDTERRLRELDGDGVVAEVLFPNTIPPFFPSGNLLAPLPTRAEYERRWAGIQAHNRWAAEHGLTGGIMLPGGPPGHPDIEPLWSDVYGPLWQKCEELDVTMNHHAGGGI